MFNLDLKLRCNTLDSDISLFVVKRNLKHPIIIKKPNLGIQQRTIEFSFVYNSCIFKKLLLRLRFGNSEEFQDGNSLTLFSAYLFSKNSGIIFYNLLTFVLEEGLV